MTQLLSRRSAIALTSACLIPGLSFAQDASQSDASDIVIEDMVLGAEDAPVTVIEYASFTCPHCANFHKDVFTKLRANYIDTGQVKFIYREVYFDRLGLWASMIARCAPKERYFGLASLIFEKQGVWAGASNSEEAVQHLLGYGRQAGMNDDDMRACLSDAETAQALVGWFQDNSKRDDITATPSFLINDEKSGNMNYDDFSAKLDSLLNN